MSCQDKQRALDNCDQKYGTGSSECDGLWMELQECRRKQKAGKRRSRKGGRKSRKSRKGGRKSRKSKKVGRKSRKSRK